MSFTAAQQAAIFAALRSGGTYTITQPTNATSQSMPYPFTSAELSAMNAALQNGAAYNVEAPSSTRVPCPPQVSSGAFSIQFFAQGRGFIQTRPGVVYRFPFGIYFADLEPGTSWQDYANSIAGQPMATAPGQLGWGVFAPPMGIPLTGKYEVRLWYTWYADIHHFFNDFYMDGGFVGQGGNIGGNPIQDIHHVDPGWLRVPPVTTTNGWGSPPAGSPYAFKIGIFVPTTDPFYNNQGHRVDISGANSLVLPVRVTAGSGGWGRKVYPDPRWVASPYSLIINNPANYYSTSLAWALETIGQPGDINGYASIAWALGVMYSPDANAIFPAPTDIWTGI